MDENTRTYKGTKVVLATPMTRGAYNKFRGWTIPADENPDDTGYLVEYTDGGKPNVEGHKGYVSWSPAEVFEVAYHQIEVGFEAAPEPSDWRTRLAVEAEELGGRLYKLREFMATDTFDTLPWIEKDELHKQSAYMGGYLEILVSRISRLPPRETTDLGEIGPEGVEGVEGDVDEIDVEDPQAAGGVEAINADDPNLDPQSIA